MLKFAAPLLAISTLIVATTPANAQSRHWEYVTVEDSFTDVERHLAGTQGSGRQAAFICAEGEEPNFLVRNNYLDIEIGDTRTVTWRVDHEPPVTEIWENLSGNQGGAGLFDERALTIARAIRDASERIIIRSGGETKTYTVSGSTAAISQALEACGYED